jgi:HlyD family type I secretion membrane fusion protein
MTTALVVRPAEGQLATLCSSRRELSVGVTILGTFFVLFLGWAALTPLDAGAVAQGVVAVSGNRQSVQHRDGGIVTALNVTEGQFVRRGDLLMTISATDIVAAERGMTGEVVNLLAMRERLRAERDHLASIATPAEYQTLDPEDAGLAAEAIHGQRLLHAARLDAMGSERNVIGQQIEQYHAQIAGNQHQIKANLEQQRLIKDELAGLVALQSRGFVSLNRIREMERNAAQLDGGYGAYTSEIARTKKGIGESRMQMVLLANKRIEEDAAQLRDAEVRLNDLRPKLLALRDQIKRATIRATATGRVVGLKAHTVGGVVAAGDMLMEIVPVNRDLVVEAKASPNDADDLRIGMETQVRFSALHERSIPVLHGKISKVSADSFEDAQTGTRHFRIEIVVPPAELAKIRQARGDLGLRPGLPAEVVVPIRKRTALGYLIEPLTQMLWLAGRES